MSKIVLFGGSGILGTELQKACPTLICPSSKEVNITDLNAVKEYIHRNLPEIIINAAAVTDNRQIEKFPASAIESNIIGAANISIVCNELGIRLCYISTDYIYKGDKGNYKETDEILPYNTYSWTKLGGECSTVCVKNHLIIRTSFGKSTFDYPEAFIDKWTSKDYVDKIAPLIFEACTSPLIGVLNLGTDRKTLYSHASERNKNVKGIKLSDSAFATPKDTSLNLQKWIDYKGDSPISKPHQTCRVCLSKNLIKYLDLGIMPLANNLEFTAVRAKETPRFPLQVLFCNDCYLSQLSTVIDPSKMFSYYTYRSSVNMGYVRHCKKMATELQKKYSLNKDSFMVDIAGNDGTLLKQFKEQIGLKVLNIDPANNLVAIAESNGIESIADFWRKEVAENIFKKYDRADIITATNVFAHVDNVKDFMDNARYLLKDNGVLILEFPYLVDFIENYEFDTVYFEHLSYFGTLPIFRLCKICNMKVIDIEKQDIHGGTIRVTIAKEESTLQETDNVMLFYNKEIEGGYDKIEKYIAWADKIKSTIDNFSRQVFKLKKRGAKIAAFGASAKGNTLLNSASMNTDIIKYIADETPEKIGKYSPRTGIPIVNKQELIKDPPDYLIILSWNFKDEIIEKVSKIYNGKYIIPIPYFSIIE